MIIVHFPQRFIITDPGLIPKYDGAPIVYDEASPLLPPEDPWRAPWNFNIPHLEPLMNAFDDLASNTTLMPIANKLHAVENGYDLELSIMRLKPGKSAYALPFVVSSEYFESEISLQILELPYLINLFQALTENNFGKLKIIQSQEFKLSDLNSIMDTSKLQSIPGCVS